MFTQQHALAYLLCLLVFERDISGFSADTVFFEIDKVNMIHYTLVTFTLNIAITIYIFCTNK